MNKIMKEAGHYIKYNNSLNILIVEDSKSVNRILANEFKKEGHNSIQTYSINEAREVLKTNHIDHIMLDMHLPDGEGYELIEELQNSHEKIFVLTSEKDSQLREISYKKGVIDYIQKDKNFFQKIKQIIKEINQLEMNKSKNILIIDDSIIVQKQLGDLLRHRNYMVETAASAQEALELLQTKKIDLILLDLILKDCNGLDFLQKNKNDIIEVKKIPVMIISGNIDSSTIRDGLKAGAVDLLKKPYVIEEIVLKVDLWIDYNRKEQEILSNQRLLTQYKDTVDRSSIVSKTNPKGIITYVNDEFCKITGYSYDELIGQPHNIVRHPDNSPSVFEHLWHTIKDLKQPWSGELKNRKKDNSPYWVKATIHPILDTEGNIIEYIAVRTDITQQEKIKQFFEKRMNISNKKFTSALNLSQEYEKAINESAILTRSDLNGNLTYINDKFIELTGYTKEELIGKNHSLLKHEDTPKEMIKQLWETIKSGNIWRGIIKNKNKKGDPYWVNTTIVPIRDENSTVIEYMAIRHNLTEVFELHNEIEETQREVVYKMGEIGEARSKETGNHVKRVAEYSKLLAILYGLEEEEADILMAASPMHDIGKVGIPDDILKKPGKLTEEEFKKMKTHTIIGKKVLKGSNRPVLQAAAIVAYEHHEKWNGKGYPRGIKGDEIHIYGRITALADVFDALGSDRCYKKAWEDEKIFKLFKEERGEHFDPELVDIFFENKNKFLEIRDKYQD